MKLIATDFYILGSRIWIEIEHEEDRPGHSLFKLDMVKRTLKDIMSRMKG